MKTVKIAKSRFLGTLALWMVLHGVGAFDCLGAWATEVDYSNVFLSADVVVCATLVEDKDSLGRLGYPINLYTFKDQILLKGKLEPSSKLLAHKAMTDRGAKPVFEEGERYILFLVRGGDFVTRLRNGLRGATLPEADMLRPSGVWEGVIALGQTASESRGRVRLEKRFGAAVPPELLMTALEMFAKPERDVENRPEVLRIMEALGYKKFTDPGYPVSIPIPTDSEGRPLLRPPPPGQPKTR
jgi:hypothetical protein